MKNSVTRKLVTVSILVALNVVLSRFVSINAWNIKIGFTFLTVFAAGYLFGPIYGGLTGALGDFVGAILFPIGPYFPGFTLTAFFSGLIYGILLKRNTKTLNTGLAVFLNQFVCGLLINTYWIFVLYNKPSYTLVMAGRVFQAVLMTVIEFVVIKLVGPYLEKMARSINE